MKTTFALSILFAVLSASAAVFNVGSKLNPASVEITEQQDRLLITCHFKAQTKFSADRNAFFNSRKAQRLCHQGILLYSKAKRGEQIDLSNITVEKAPVTEGKMVKYFYSKLINKGRIAAAAAPEKTVQKKSKAESTPEQETAVHRKKSVIFVYRYETENGNLKVLETNKYSRKTFKSQQEFDDFCEKQFKSIDDQAERNRQEVLKNFEKSQRAFFKKGEL